MHRRVHQRPFRGAWLADRNAGLLPLGPDPVLPRERRDARARERCGLVEVDHRLVCNSVNDLHTQKITTYIEHLQ
jgi:hypothetical protein